MAASSTLVKNKVAAGRLKARERGGRKTNSNRVFRDDSLRRGHLSGDHAEIQPGNDLGWHEPSVLVEECWLQS